MKRECKKSIITVLLIVFMFSLAVASALTFMPIAVNAVDGETQAVTLSEASDFNITAGVLSGLSEDGQNKIANASSYSVVVPDTVTEITEGAFAGLGRLTSLNIPFVGKSATAIGEEGVFSYIFGKVAYIGAAKTEQVYNSSENNAATNPDVYNPNCTLGSTYAGYVPYLLKEVTVNGGALSHGAFSNCVSLKKVTLQNIDTVGDLAFYQSSVSEVDLGDVTVINRRAFQNVANLRAIDLSKVTSIGRFAFSESGLFSVELPSALGENLGQYAFFNCAYLTKVKVNNGVKVVKANGTTSPFNSSCRICEVIDLREDGEGVDKSVEFWKGSYNIMGDSVVVTADENFVSGIINVDGYVFHKVETGCDFVEYVGEEKDLVLPDANALSSYGITQYKVGAQAFYYSDRSFVTAYIPSCVTEIGASAFLDSGIIKVTIGEEREDGNYPEIRYIYNVTFWGCATLREVFIYSSYQATNNQGQSVDPMFGKTEYVDYDYDKQQWIVEHTYLDNVNLYNAAKGGEEPESNVKQIGDYVFNKSSDNKVELLAYLGKGGIISLPTAEQVVSTYSQTDGTYSIGEKVFAKNSDITGIVIPEAVTEIGAHAFKECPVLVNVSIAGTNLKKIGAEAFEHCSALAAISIPDSVTHIGTAAFRYCSSLTSVSLPASLTTWGTEQLVGGIESDRGYIFMSCINLTSVTIPANVTDIPQSAFYGCSSLTNVTFAEGSKVETIGANSFYEAPLTSIVLPASVNSVGVSAFGNSNTIKQLYLEGAGGMFNQSFTPTNVKFKSVYVANASDALEFNQTYNFESDSTAFLPTGASASLVNRLKNAAIIVVPDKATYDAIMGNSEVEATTKNKLYWQTEITFTVTDTLGNIYVEKQDKLASNNGASIKFVLFNDEAGHAYIWRINEAYSLPSAVGGNIVDSSKWQDDSDNMLTIDTTIGANGLTFVMEDAVEAKITTPSDKRIEYTGEEFVLNDNTLTYVRATDKTGREISPVDVGEYLVYVKPANGVVWENGGTEERAFTLEIYKAIVTLEWYYNISTLIPGDSVYELTYFDELRIALFSARFNDITLTTNNGNITAVKDGQVSGDLSLIGEGLYRFTATHKNYEFTNAELLVRVNPVEIDLSDNFTWTASTETDSLLVSSGMVYISSNESTTIIHSLQHPSIVYTDIRDVVNSIVRYTGETTTLTIAGNNYYTIDSITGNVQISCGMYTIQATLKANSNYKLTTSLVNDFAKRGMTVTISADGKTAEITKTWFIIELENELLDSSASIAGNKWVEFKIDSWTFGDNNISISAPRLVHGDEDGNWQSNKNVTFELIRNNDEIIVNSFDRSKFDYYINGSMPAGNYKLIATVSVIIMGGQHTHWWNNEQHNSTDSGLQAQGFTRTYEFTVANANITVNPAKLSAGEQGFADYTWEIPTTDKELFFKSFADMVNDEGAINLVTVERSGYWATEAANGYYGSHVISYNFARMNNETYYEASDNHLLGYIDADLPDTYTVYFQITALNHNYLTDTGVDGRYDYFFTVTVYKMLTTPTVIDAGLEYTGNKVLPEIADSDLYETVWDANDTYVNGGQHSVSFKLYDGVHYRWKADETKDTVSVSFVIAKADNDFTVALNMLGWNYETFDAAVNNIRATAKYLDNGQSIHFRVVKKGAAAAESGLDDFAIDANGKVNATVASKLKALAVGQYTLYAKINETANYNGLERYIEFAVSKDMNSWADGEDDLVLPSWIVGTFDLEENVIVVKAAHGEAIIEIRDIDGNVYYSSLNPEENTLNELEVGKYLLVAWVPESENYSALEERAFTIEVLEKIGLPWWGTMLVVIGALALAAAIILILWKLKVFEILTDKIALAITQRATIDATIAAVRATKRTQEANEHLRKVEFMERMEAGREAQRNMTPEERAQALTERAEATATKAERMHARASKIREQADKQRGQTEQPEEAVEPEATDEQPEEATDNNPTEE